MNQNINQGLLGSSAKTRGAAIRAQKRNQDDANRVIKQYEDASQKCVHAY